MMTLYISLCSSQLSGRCILFTSVTRAAQVIQDWAENSEGVTYSYNRVPYNHIPDFELFPNLFPP